MSEVKTEPETKYITLAAVEYDPDEGTKKEGYTTDIEIVRLPTFCHQVGKNDLITFRRSYKVFKGVVIAKQTYNTEDNYLSMLLRVSCHSLEGLSTVETKIEETKVTW